MSHLNSIQKTVLFLFVVASLFLISCVPAGETEGDEQALAGEASLSTIQRAVRAVERLSDDELASLHLIMKKGKDPTTIPKKIITAGKVLKRVPAEQRLAIVDAEVGKRLFKIRPCTFTADCPFSPLQTCGVDESGENVCESPNPVGSRCRSDEECAAESDCQLSAIDSTSENFFDRMVGRCIRCDPEPVHSCVGPGYVPSTSSCDTERYRRLGYDIYTCYTCSVSEEMRTTAECPEGWGEEDSSLSPAFPDGVSWIDGGFQCRNTCVNDCEDDPEPECIRSCEIVDSLVSPCPEGYTFTPKIPNSPYSYDCLFPGVTTSGLPGADTGFNPIICGQCGTSVFFTNTNSGDVMCVHDPNNYPVLIIEGGPSRESDQPRGPRI